MIGREDTISYCYMKVRLDYKSFLGWLKNLETDKYTELYICNEESDDILPKTFRKISFIRNIILYEDLSDTISILQDSPVSSWEDSVADLYEAFTFNGENILYIIQ